MNMRTNSDAGKSAKVTHRSDRSRKRRFRHCCSGSVSHPDAESPLLVEVTTSIGSLVHSKINFDALVRLVIVVRRFRLGEGF